ncbi:MAG TPA: malonic semialdehyde reductase [Tepidisphaeraceae bacterium]|jgi:3-hydroxypropanoate dehydrogenase|nr:malonic semialdehyde reductase [Tepidisphaeraceae bacterium]
MANPASDECLNVIFREAHTHSAWLAKPVDDVLLREVYDLAKLGPTSANTNPMRVVFVKSAEGKERLKPALSPGNVEKTMAAPVCAIIANDMRFHELIPRLWPHMPEMADAFTQPGKEEFVATFAFRNATLQGAYLIIAARALGLDAGPMSGFDNAKVDAEFFPDGRLKSNFLINLGHGDPAKLRPRNPRLSFEEACQII